MFWNRQREWMCVGNARRETIIVCFITIKCAIYPNMCLCNKKRTSHSVLYLFALWMARRNCNLWRNCIRNKENCRKTSETCLENNQINSRNRRKMRTKERETLRTRTNSIECTKSTMAATSHQSSKQKYVLLMFICCHQQVIRHQFFIYRFSFYATHFKFW